MPQMPGIQADWRALPFKDDSFACVFADPPWGMNMMADCGEFCRHALYLAPVLYVMSPWMWVHRMARRDKIWIREFPGINVPILLIRYERVNTSQMSLFGA